MFAIAEAEYRRTLDAHAVLDFHDVLLKARAAPAADGGVCAEPLSTRSRAITTCSSTSSRTRAARSGSSWSCSSHHGAKGRVWRTPGRCNRRSSSSATGSSRSTAFVTRMSRCCARRVAIWSSLRPGGDVRRSISRSFRSVPALLAFVNDRLRDAGYGAVAAGRVPLRRSRIGSNRETPERRRAARPGPRRHARRRARSWSATKLPAWSRQGTRSGSGHRNQAPDRPETSPSCFARARAIASSNRRSSERGIPAYVYKGLGFFDADEIKDVLALLRYLADPTSDLRAAAVLRSGFGRVSDEGLRRLAPGLADVLLQTDRPDGASTLDDDDRTALDHHAPEPAALVRSRRSNAAC